eukprot:m.5703 g.5703  ORF g.5703 m.5703 type:complete len:104 (-) comp3365_c0_seq2:143-454(-)
MANPFCFKNLVVQMEMQCFTRICFRVYQISSGGPELCFGNGILIQKPMRLTALAQVGNTVLGPFTMLLLKKYWQNGVLLLGNEIKFKRLFGTTYNLFVVLFTY